ncbi:MAG: MOSC domain-containing protein [Anaerolineae bacterium]|nr:MOSC domain-containing protein [Candidatus Roseilinea sp.]MDW8448875.1 MOSC domain-containing protein [Anaerolineae bacterium]
MTICVSALYRYPIKSCKGHALQTAVTDARGIAGDRRMMIVDALGEFITQRDLPRLALIEPVMNDDGSMTLRAPGMPPLSFTPSNEGRRLKARVWNDVCDAIDQGNDVAGWLQDFLAAPVRLVRMADDFVRRVDARYARRPSDQTGFADGYPFLLISQASLDDLNARLDSPVPMNRFRPNIVVSGCNAFAEDEWREFRIGDIVFSAVKPCARCSVPAIDQDTAIAGREPIKTLATYRTFGRKVLFGQNLVAANTGVLRVGDAVEIIAKVGSP